LDVVRLAAVLSVILVHSTSLAVSNASLPANAVLQISHITRSVFLMLSAFVLTHSAMRRPISPRKFWSKRYPLVVWPYIAWSGIYFLTGGRLHSLPQASGRFLVDLADGGAHFHLYFLLLTLQLYLIFPTLIAAVRRWPGVVRYAVAASLVFELAFTTAVHYGWRPNVAAIWLDHPGSWLVSYPLYIVAGIAAAWHFDRFTAWVRAHPRLIAAWAAGSAAAATVSYLADITVIGYDPVKASEVFQPTDVLLAMAATVGVYAVGLRVADRARERDCRRLDRASDASFGVFLAHPLVLAGVLALASKTGIAATVSRWPSGVLELLVAVGLVPAVYVLSFMFVRVARGTHVSVALTGRPPEKTRRLTWLEASRRPIAAVGAYAIAIRCRRWLPVAVIAALGVTSWALASNPASVQGANSPSGPTGPHTGTASPSSAPANSAGSTTTTTPATPPSIPTTTSSVQWVTQSHVLSFDGVTRSYLLYRPSAPQPAPIPVVVELAGCCISGPAVEAARADFRQVAGPAILVYPASLGDHWNAGFCCGSASTTGVDDMGFVAAVISQVQSQQPDATTGPVYLAGYSNGAKLGSMIACQRPDLVRAVAIYGSTRTSPCALPPPVSLLLLAGTADPEDPIQGPPVTQNGFTEPTVEQMADSYLAVDHCGTATAAQVAGMLTETLWPDCANGRQIGEAFWTDQTHAWPETTGSTPSAQQVIWDWFTTLTQAAS
jgi:poly(3-hydroxybutyrate) depolymerase/peptidoglycan/LPS O-acetylase OafA/YrhL